MTTEGFRSGFVALVGRPNVGKSTLMNHLIGQKIAITSNRPQTTRNQIRTIYTSDQGQIIFLDTPGIHKAKNKLGEYMDDVALETLTEADLILWLVEASDFSGEGERYIADQLKKGKKPVILVMNKIDLVEKKNLAAYMDKYKRLYPFRKVIPVSALRSVNTDSLLEEVFACLPEGPRFYDPDEVTDQTMRQIAAEMIREKALRCLNEEIPHGIAIQILSMKETARRHPPKNPDRVYGDMDTIYEIEACIITEKESHKGIIIGKGGAMLKKIGTGARIAIEGMTDAQVNLKLFVKVRKDWRDNASFLKSLGYDRKQYKK